MPALTNFVRRVAVSVVLLGAAGPYAAGHSMPPATPPGSPMTLRGTPPAPRARQADTAVVLTVAPIEGRDFKSIYREAIGKARALGLTPFVEYSAPWCGPCEELRQQLEARPIAPETLDEFQGVALLRINTGEWKPEGVVQQAMGVGKVLGIPEFFAIDTAGRQIAHVYGIEWITGAEDITQPDGPPADRDFFHHHLWPAKRGPRGRHK